MGQRARDGDEVAVAELALSQSAMVVSMAWSFARLGAEHDDLVSEGFLGLLEAARRFDPDRGTRFATYARWWVLHHMRSHLSHARHVVRPGRTRALMKVRHKLGRTRRAIAQQTGRAPTADQIAEQLDVDVDDVRSVQREIAGTDVAISSDGPSGRNVEPVAPAPSPEELTIRAELREQARENLRLAIEELDSRERKIVGERHLTDEPRSLRALGDDLGISRERVRQLERRAFDKMRSAGGVDWQALR